MSVHLGQENDGISYSHAQVQWEEVGLMVLEQVPAQVLEPSVVGIRERHQGAVAAQDKRLAPVVGGRMCKPGHLLVVGPEEDK